ncbi:MAG: hypothetical protein V1781_02090 [Bacteroidota bacterium]
MLGRVVKTFDNNLAIIDYTGSFMKIDQNGNFLFRKTYPNSPFSFSSIEQTPDSGFIFAGTCGQGGPQSKMTLIKMDINGNLKWVKTYGAPANVQGNRYEGGSDAKQTLDGGYIIVGSTESFGTMIDMYVVKTDSLGNLQWSKNYHRYDCINCDLQGISVQITSDNNYIIFSDGSTAPVSYGSNFSLMKINQSGDLLWNKSYGGTKMEYGSSVKISKFIYFCFLPL